MGGWRSRLVGVGGAKWVMWWRDWWVRGCRVELCSWWSASHALEYIFEYLWYVRDTFHT